MITLLRILLVLFGVFFVIILRLLLKEIFGFKFLGKWKKPSDENNLKK